MAAVSCLCSALAAPSGQSCSLTSYMWHLRLTSALCPNIFVPVHLSAAIWHSQGLHYGYFGLGPSIMASFRTPPTSLLSGPQVIQGCPKMECLPCLGPLQVTLC